MFFAISLKGVDKRLMTLRSARDKALAKEAARHAKAVANIKKAYALRLKAIGMSIKSTPVKIVLWNCYNAGHRDRGAKTVKVQGYAERPTVHSKYRRGFNRAVR